MPECLGTIEPLEQVVEAQIGNVRGRKMRADNLLFLAELSRCSARMTLTYLLWTWIMAVYSIQGGGSGVGRQAKL